MKVCIIKRININQHVTYYNYNFANYNLLSCHVFFLLDLKNMITVLSNSVQSIYVEGLLDVRKT